MTGKTAIVILPNGAEEMELVIAIDVLRRAEVVVTVAGLETDGPVKCSRDVLISCDYSFEDAVLKGPFDVVVLPGGLGGTKHMCSSLKLGSFLQKQEASGKIIAAICAAPLALKAHGVGIGKKLTSYPSVREQLMDGGQYKYVEEKVVLDDNLLTSRAPGTAFEFALALVEMLQGKDVRDTISKALLLTE